MKTLPLLASACALLLGPLLQAETVKDREGAVRQDKASLENSARWIYHDFTKGFAEAIRTGKPLLVVLRCVPCKACMGIDNEVVFNEGKLGPLLDQFVCVRVIDANALDLARFQFDFDLSFSTLFFNGDGTLYGRFGSWKHQRDPEDKTTTGFQRTLEAVLALHRGYPANRASLAGKQAEPLPYKTPVEIPLLSAKYTHDLDWSGKVVQSCVHCHMIGDAVRTAYRDQRQPIPEAWVFPNPPPETLGLHLAANAPAHVDSIDPGSAAAQGGLLAGDDLVSIDGQPLISVADVSWAFHRAPASGALPIVARRGDQEVKLSLALTEHWRTKADISRRTGTWPMRGMATGGMLVEDLSSEERERRGLKADQLALLVKFVGQFGKHAAAKNAGFLKDDVIVQIDGATNRMTEGEVIGRLLQSHPAGDKVSALILRNEQRLPLELPMQ